MKVDMLLLRRALEASWDEKTANLGVMEIGNPALGNCYPTARIVQMFYPKAEIVEGQVWTGKSMEKHFWNILDINSDRYHIDFTWQQFPHGSYVKTYKVRNRETLGDGPQTIRRVELLYKRVQTYISSNNNEII